MSNLLKAKANRCYWDQDSGTFVWSESTAMLDKRTAWSIESKKAINNLPKVVQANPAAENSNAPLPEKQDLSVLDSKTIMMLQQKSLCERALLVNDKDKIQSHATA